MCDSLHDKTLCGSLGLVLIHARETLNSKCSPNKQEKHEGPWH